MTEWQPFVILEAELRRIEDRLLIDPDDIQTRFDRANLLNCLGRPDDARTAYLDLLSRSPTHFGALNNLAALLSATGFTTAAKLAYVEAVKHHPNNPVGHLHLANALAMAGDSEASFRHFEMALELDPHMPETHQGLSKLFTDLGDEENARAHRVKGFRDRPLMVVPYRGKQFPISLLVLDSAIGGSVPIQNHIDNQIFLTSVLFVDFCDPDFPLPPHHLVFNAIGDADLAQSSLAAAERILSRTAAPVINLPSAVRQTGRAANAQRFRNIDGVLTPKMEQLSRSALLGKLGKSNLEKSGFRFPLLVRSPGFHTGKYFARVESASQLVSSISQLPGDELLVMESLDACGSDGKYRKYRVMVIDREIYPLHLAVSSNWKVHYFTADMQSSAEYRAEDEAFLTRMPQILGPRAIKALGAICDQLQLDYAGIDFGLDQQGNLLLFEANATMVVNPPETDVRWNYRRGPVQAILEAIRRLLTTRIHSKERLFRGAA